jgi:hypothetical protein
MINRRAASFAIGSSLFQNLIAGRAGLNDECRI